MKYHLFLSSLLLASLSFGQELTCEDFKKGEFIMNTFSSPVLEWDMTRDGNKQVETIKELPEEFQGIGYPMDPKTLRIEWIDDCTYKLFADDANGELDSISQLINDSGGIHTELIKIEGKCFYYKSICIIEGEEIVSEGKLCKK
ncbi:hypothetical protein [Psychroserpens algicola]|uniref:Uncharacterized protein n=1 Tax=Psychroserpens algicola TaxID=1719034 RepID=A0ABT0HCU9_9FLAO|nr:hypothetical protein [Psychroserpens algicola]MCK8481690.1 hypothetical protein [Psychroserpens algicola]